MASPQTLAQQLAPLARKYGGKFGIAARDLLGLIDVETGGTFKGGLVSPAGARGRTQFMPGTARQYKVKIGDAASEVRGAAEYLHDLGYSKNRKLALAKYNGGPGNPQMGYANEVVKRSGKWASLVGKGSPAGALLTASGDASGATTPVTSTRSSDNMGSGADALSLLQSLSQVAAPQPRPTAGLARPGFSAGPVMPEGAAIPSGGGGATAGGQPDIAQLLASISTPGMGIAKTTVTGGDPVATAGGGATAGGKVAKGAIGGSPVPGMKPHGPTHPTAGLEGFPAYDYMAKAGTTVVAPVTGKIVKVSGSDPKGGPSNGVHGPFGLSVYIRGDDGRTYYLTHLGSRNAKVGQRVKRGAVIGSIGNYAKWGGADHVHMGVRG